MLFSFLKCPMQDKTAEQDVARCLWLFSILHGCCSYSSHGAPSHPATSSSAWLHPSLLTLYAKGKQLCFLLLVLQQTALWTTAILFKSLGKYVQTPEVLHKPTHIWAVCAEAKRAKPCFYVNNLSVSERLQCTEHSDARKTLVQSALGHCSSFKKLLELLTTEAPPQCLHYTLLLSPFYLISGLPSIF